MRRLIIIGAVAIVALFAVSAVANAVDPHRLVNPDKCTRGEAQAFWQPRGTWEVNGFLTPNGKIKTFEVALVDKPGFQVGLPAGFLEGFGHDKADVWVETSVRGPGNVTLIDYASEKQSVDISLSGQFTNQVFPGTWTGPTVCFPETGQATWTFTLIWADKVVNTREVFNQQTLVTAV